MLDLSHFRGYRAADALTRAAPVGRTEFASLTVLFPCSNFVSSLGSPCKGELSTKLTEGGEYRLPQAISSVRWTVEKV